MIPYEEAHGRYTRLAVRLNAERLAATEEVTAKALKQEHVEGFLHAILSLDEAAEKSKGSRASRRVYYTAAVHLRKEAARLKLELADD
jgi:hypothetical protein